MVSILLALIVGWSLASTFFSLVEFLLNYFSSSIGKKTIIKVKLSILTFLILVLFLISPYSEEIVNLVYASEGDNPEDHTPSKTLYSLKLETRHVLDGCAFALITKFGISAMSQSSTVGGKAVLAATSVGALGAVYAMSKYAENVGNAGRLTNTNLTLEVSSKEVNSASKSKSNSSSDFNVNSSLEDTGIEALVEMLKIIEALLSVALILFIAFLTILWMRHKINSSPLFLNKMPKPFCGNIGQWFIKRISKLFYASSVLYLVWITVLILFILSASRYYIGVVLEFLYTVT